ncbi:hypothetical protein [Sinorhizobium sp. A49]|uniref:hypothetical protein n=1 Tax=Sinorhizobium sp. A49 TaxID=1945861 RepID=UPI0009855AD8|nr:hypothetical protein [Sinorhizobium sp. A49]OOG72911.1 hypothetical protein B0E45_07950 [Sinorhizobium sp. A49]
MATEPCSCGPPFWRIASIAGRREETLRIARRGGFQFAPLRDGLKSRISVFPGVDADAVSRKIEDAVRTTLTAVDAQTSSILVKGSTPSSAGSGAKEKLVAAPVTRLPDES